MRPAADLAREASARELFPLDLSAEEYAARYAHRIGCSSFDDYSYMDPKLDAWIQHFHAIMRTPGKVAECRRKYLTPEEIAAIEDELASGGGL